MRFGDGARATVHCRVLQDASERRIAHAAHAGKETMAERCTLPRA